MITSRTTNSANFAIDVGHAEDRKRAVGEGDTMDTPETVNGASGRVPDSVAETISVTEMPRGRSALSLLRKRK